MCGLFGFNGDPKKMNRTMARMVQAKVKILGLYNIDRGKHSCGVYMDNQILKGINDDKLFSDFIQNNELPDATRSGNYNIIGHTRMATHGEHTLANAHPFKVENEFVLAHNGVIRNVWTLCNKYKINHTNIKVDSLALAHLVHQEGFKVLNEYEGFAALLMAKASEPNSMYLYRGVSVRTKEGKYEEERPLYYMIADEGIYVSSLEKSLLAITDSDKETIKQLEGNVVCKITNGRFTKAKTVINRETINIGVSTNTHGGSPSANYPKQGVGQTTTCGTATGSNSTQSQACTSPTGQTNSRVHSSYPANSRSDFKTDFDRAIVPLIWHESLPKKATSYSNEEGIFFHQGRYWIVENDEIRLAHGHMRINKRGKVLAYANNGYGSYWFFEGVMMRNEKCWNAAKEDHDLKNTFFNFASNVSKYSMYPVCNLRSDAFSRCKNVSNYFKYRWFEKNNMMGNGGFTPQFSERNYVIRNGLTHSISTQKHSREDTIDTQGLKAERMHVEGTSVEEKALAPIVQMKTILEQKALPFAEIVQKEEYPTPVKPKERDITNFYRTWENINQVRVHLDRNELNAIRYYVCDVMMHEMEILPDSIFEDTVETQVNMFLNVCIENGTSINENWDEKNYQDIEHYLDIAEANPEGKFMDESPIETGITVNNVNDVFPPDDTEPSIADMAYQKEQWAREDLQNEMIIASTEEILGRGFHEEAAVPSDKEANENVDENGQELYVEEVEDEDERAFAVQDAVDYMGSIRDAADDLQVRENDDFAQEIANALYTTIDPLYHRLREICDNHKESDLSDYVNSNIKAKLTL
jgi:hypothetical protein